MPNSVLFYQRVSRWRDKETYFDNRTGKNLSLQALKGNKNNEQVSRAGDRPGDRNMFRSINRTLWRPQATLPLNFYALLHKQPEQQSKHRERQIFKAVPPKSYGLSKVCEPPVTGALTPASHR
jgi:hypothetical protein